MSYLLADFPGLSREEYTDFVNEAFVQEAIIRPTLTDLSRFVTPGTSQVTCPTFESPDPVKFDSSAGTCLTPRKGVYGTEILNIDCQVGDAWCIDRRTRQQTVTGEFVVREGETRARKLALDFDNRAYADMIANIDPANVGAVSGAAALDSIADVVELRRLLNKKNVPQSDRYLLIGCDHEANLLKLENFVSAERYGSREALLNGEIGRLMGFTVLVSTVVDNGAGQPIAYHRSHEAYAVGQELLVEADYQHLCKQFEFSMDHLFGLKTMNAGCHAATLV